MDWKRNLQPQLRNILKLYSEKGIKLKKPYLGNFNLGLQMLQSIMSDWQNSAKPSKI